MSKRGLLTGAVVMFTGACGMTTSDDTSNLPAVCRLPSPAPTGDTAGATLQVHLLSDAGVGIRV